jgi:outer membrane protein TolC
LALGEIDHLAILIAEQIERQIRINLIQARVNRITDTVAYFKLWAAAGGTEMMS